MIIFGILLAAVGAVLHFAVGTHYVASIHLQDAGTILIITGVVLFVIGLVQQMRGQRRTVVREHADGSQTREMEQRSSLPPQ